MFCWCARRQHGQESRGQWQLADAYRYLSEAYGGRHWNKMYGINLDAGIFMSYVGLFSCYNFDNWAYQPSYVSSNTPRFFNGIRVQFFPTEHLKIERWLINRWQSDGMFASVTFGYMPEFSTFRFEVDHRQSNVPYFAGPGGVTPSGGNQGLPGSIGRDSSRTGVGPGRASTWH